MRQIIHNANDKDSKLGDFKYDAATKTATDYTYDVNGNLFSDQNKKITSIVYNHLDLPSLITVQGKGTITYTYDAAGNKLKKVTTDNIGSSPKVTTTLYVGTGVFQNDSLQFIGMEEGRIRFVKPNPKSCTPGNDRFVFDYFLKDHLGNVRAVLTDQVESICYIPATVEDSRYQTEDDIYNIVDARRIDKSTAGASSVGSFENKVYRTHGGIAGEKTGLGATLKVMAGDEVNMMAQSFYTMPGGGPGGYSLLSVASQTTKKITSSP